MKIPFVKMHGCGNDYVYIDARDGFPAPPEELAVRLSDRHKSIGGDGVIFVCGSTVADARMRMFNLDGSEGKMCGNGIRCVAKFVYDRGIAVKDTLKIETGSGVKTIAVQTADGKVTHATVDMGAAILRPQDIPTTLPGERAIAVPLTVDGSQAGEELYEGALRKLCEIKRGGVILCDSTKPEVLHKLKEQVELASQNERERLAVGCVAKEQAAQTAKSLNCERMVLCCQKAGMKEESLTVCAAAVAAMLAVGEAMDSYHSRPLEGIEQLEPLSEQEIETLLGDGVTVLEMADGQAECIRWVTTRTRTGNEEDRTFSSVNVVMMIDEIIRAVRERLSEMLKGKRVGFSQDSVVSQAAVVLDEKKQQGLITSFEPPVAYVQKEDPSVCVVELEFDLAAVFSRIYLTAHISI